MIIPDLWSPAGLEICLLRLPALWEQGGGGGGGTACGEHGAGGNSGAGASKVGLGPRPCRGRAAGLGHRAGSNGLHVQPPAIAAFSNGPHKSGCCLPHFP